MDEDTLPPLLNMDGENVAIASGVKRRPSLRLRGSNSSLNSQMYPSTRRTQTQPSRKFSQSSVDDILPPRFTPADVKPDHDDEDGDASIASTKLLLFFAIPVMAGLMFENGASITVDLALVALAALILYWSLEVPWQWYHYARRMAIDEWAAYRESDEVIVEESEADGEEAQGNEREAKRSDSQPSASQSPTTSVPKDKSVEWRTLRAYELFALASCFTSPAATSYALHRIRGYLARPAGSPVENASFILFVMAAELPALRQVCKLLFAHTLYLQRVVTSYDVLEDNKVKALRADLEKEREEFAVLKRRFDDLETAQSSSQHRSSGPKSAWIPTNHAPDQKGGAIETQVNSLNRAVRQYEKRAITQQVLLEARLRDLDMRINDALTLAAAASRTSQRSNPVLDLATSMIMLPVHLTQAVFAWPLSTFSQLYHFLFGPRKRKKKSGGRSRLESNVVSKGRDGK